MNDQKNKRSKSMLWAEFRFSVVGALLASPPGRGELQSALRTLATRTWKHPITGEPAQYSFSTIERWYYRCLREQRSPVSVLRRKVREDKGCQRKIGDKAKELLQKQYQLHPCWSYQLHADNLGAKLTGDCPSYATVRRFMQSSGLAKQKKTRFYNRDGSRRAKAFTGSKEVRSFEVDHVCGLWHLDFHHCSRQVLTSAGGWHTPLCLSVMDDHSRLACHVQWYLSEDTEHLVHGFSQAIQKRGLPRALLSDNGSAMVSAEFTEGLLRLSVLHETTLPYSPYQNGKQERFFGSLEGRLIAMLEGVKDLTLSQLNDATTAWVEMEYNRSLHDELGETPLNRYLNGNDVSRKSPSSKDLKHAFRREIVRRLRRTDGTVSIEGKRFEVSSRYRHFKNLKVQYAKWDLTSVHLVDPDSGTLLCPLFPLDKSKNADGKRRSVEQHELPLIPNESSMAPLLEKLMEEYAATGFPPAYLPKDD